MKIKTCWFSGLTEQQTSEVKAGLLSSEKAFQRLKEILGKRLEASYTDQNSKTNYDDPCWAYKQADYIGSQRTYKEIMALIDIFDK